MENPFDAISLEIQESRRRYDEEVLHSRPFQDALRQLERITIDFLIAHAYARLQGTRFAASKDYSLFRFAPHLVEATLSITMNAKQGLQNAARRELRFLLEAAVKLSSRDLSGAATSFEERLSGLDDRSKKFDDFVAGLSYFPDFYKPEDANQQILSLYSQLSQYVHATAPQFEAALARAKRGEDPGRESVATLNKFNNLAFQVYDLVLVRIFHGIGLSLSGDIFTTILDEEPNWRFHKGKFISRLSKCFDYKAERRAKRDQRS